MAVVGDAVAALLAGEPVVLPTDTVYGLCADARSEPACRRALSLKGRSGRQPSALLFPTVDDVLAQLSDLPEPILRALLPGPYTLIFVNQASRYPWLSEETIGIRVPELLSVATEIVKQVGAVMATSANHHGGPDPRTVDDVPADIRAACGAVVDGGILPGVPSTVLDLTGDEARVLREGAVPAAEALANVRRARHH